MLLSTINVCSYLRWHLMATNDEGLVNLDSNAIRLIFNVTWAASFLSPTFWSKKEVWMKPPLPSCRLLRFVSLSLELLRYLETEFSKAYVGWKDFFPSWKTAMGDLVERHVNYPQLYVSSCVCSLLFNSDERALFAPCSDPPNLFTTYI